MGNSSSQPPASSPPLALPPVLLIHGFKGSTLKHGNRRTFLTLTQLLGLSTPDLALPLTWNISATVQDLDGGTPSTMMSDVLGSMSSVMGARAYGSPISGLHSTYGAERCVYGKGNEWSDSVRLYCFCYDWRRSNNENCDKLRQFLSECKEKPQIIAHSNGGLLAYCVLNEDPALAHSVVYAATPFRSNLSFLKDLQMGKSMGFNSTLLGPKVLSTFPSVFNLLPVDMKDAGGYVLDEQGAVTDIDFGDMKTWVDLHLVVWRFSEEEMEARVAGITKCIEDAKRFKLRCQKASKGAHPPNHCIMGVGRKTIEGVVVGDNGWDFKSYPECDGDGRFGESVCKVPVAANCAKTWRVEAKHDRVLDDSAMLVDVLKELREGVGAEDVKVGMV